MKTVLALDDDVAFLFWLAGALVSAQCNVVPAASIPEAQALLDDLGRAPNLVIINPELAGSADYVAALRRRHPSLLVLAAAGNDTPDTILRSVTADRTARKPRGLIGIGSAIADDATPIHADAINKAWQAEWLFTIQMALEGRAASTD